VGARLRGSNLCMFVSLCLLVGVGGYEASCVNEEARYYNHHHVHQQEHHPDDDANDDDADVSK